MKYNFKLKIDEYTSLDRILNCGQCFRFEQLNINKKEFLIIAKNKFVCLKQEGNNLCFSCSKTDYFNFWENYFDMKRDYKKICQELSLKDNHLAESIHKFPGIRILRQDCFETLISFIISQNNNIPRIKSIINQLCKNFGNCIYSNKNSGKKIYSFPDPSDLAFLSEQDLSPIKCGFRDKYILDAARKIHSKILNLEELANISLEKARIKLMQIKGVGPKVADCVLLYACGHMDAFPMDVWMKKIMATYYPGKDADMFGSYAGVAQQYLYHYERNIKK